MAEIDDIHRFTNKSALAAFAGVDAPPFQSGSFEAKFRHVSKRGSPHLRKTLSQIMSVALQHGSVDNPVYLFIDKKRAEGKHFYVYTVAGAAKFLRIYIRQGQGISAHIGSGVGDCCIDLERHSIHYNFRVQNPAAQSCSCWSDFYTLFL